MRSGQEASLTRRREMRVVDGAADEMRTRVGAGRAGRWRVVRGRRWRVVGLREAHDGRLLVRRVLAHEVLVLRGVGRHDGRVEGAAGHERGREWRNSVAERNRVVWRNVLQTDDRRVRSACVISAETNANRNC